MADKNIQITQRNATNDAWDNLYPKTKAINVFAADGTTTVEAHLADTMTYSTTKLNKDANDIFTEIDLKRHDGTLIMKSILSGGTSPNYTTRTETYYASNGSTVNNTVVYTRSYDSEGNLTSEVMN